MMREWGGQQWVGGGKSAVAGGIVRGLTVRVSSTSKNPPSHHKYVSKTV